MNFFIESTSLSNLYLEMMIAHMNGDLIHEAKKMTIVNDIAISKFLHYNFVEETDNKESF